MLRAIVGEIVLQQTTVGTAGGNYFWGIYIAGAKRDGSVTSFTTSAMSEVDWLRVGARGTTGSITSSVLQSTMLSSQPIEIRAKRKLKSRDQISICAQFANDAATPAGVLSGILRFLVARD